MIQGGDDFGRSAIRAGVSNYLFARRGLPRPTKVERLGSTANRMIATMPIQISLTREMARVNAKAIRAAGRTKLANRRAAADWTPAPRSPKPPPIEASVPDQDPERSKNR